MLNEIAQTRDHLREFICKELEYNFLTNLKQLEITMPHDHQLPQYGPDIKKLLYIGNQR